VSRFPEKDVDVKRSCPRLVVSGLSGGAGKTIVSLGLCRAAREAGYSVKPFKKGPDYIDANWLALASQEMASNLDPFLFSHEQIKSLFWSRCAGHDLAMIEGNRGLFDGKDVTGSCSTAELARILKAPVLLVVDCTKVTRTMAAVVLGCRMFEKDLDLRGVVLNRTAGSRHRSMLRRTIEEYTDLTVFGTLPKLKQNPIPERHMGLISDQEFTATEAAFHSLADMVRDNLDVKAIWDTAWSAPSHNEPLLELWETPKPAPEPVRIGVVRDAALWFYYQENLEALEAQGAEIVPLTLLDGSEWPELHGLYLGGGFPETLAGSLTKNSVMREKVKRLADQGLPIYAECGGFMYLGRSLKYDDHEYPMTGVFPLTTVVRPKPQGHGYIRARVAASNPFHTVGLELSGHEFHYSTCEDDDCGFEFALEMLRGHGMREHRDGLVYRNTFASYAHIHTLTVPTWAANFTAAARRFKDALTSGSDSCPDIRI
jgi:cobyrinic acid a,c-diamide synthase